MKFFTGKREFLSTARGGGTTYTSHNASARCVVGRRTRMDARLFLVAGWTHGSSQLAAGWTHGWPATMYVVSVWHIGVHYIDFLMQKGQCLAVS